MSSLKFIVILAQCRYRSTSFLDGFPIAPGSVLLVAQEASRWIRFALITTSQRLIYGDLLSVEVITGWRNGPSWLRDNDKCRNCRYTKLRKEFLNIVSK